MIECFIMFLNYQKLGHKKVTVITADTDLVVLALYAYWFLEIKHFWDEFGQGKDQRWCPIQKFAKALVEEVCIPFWYAFSGCAVVSQFGGRGKKTAWNKWRKVSNCTETLAWLSSIS